MKFLNLVFVLLSLPAFGLELPTGQCDDGSCNEFMTSVWEGFEANPFAPELGNRVYSGECRYVSQGLSPDKAHYAVLMFDELSGKPYFSTIFGFFYERDEWAEWSVEDGRREMHEDWKSLGVIQGGADHAVVVVNDDEGNPAMVYWMRQNPESKDVYYVTHWRGYMTSFCLMKAH